MCHMDGIDGGIDDLRLNVLYSRAWLELGILHVLLSYNLS